MRRLPLLVLASTFITLAALALQVTAQSGPGAPAGASGAAPTTRPDGPPPGGFHLLPRFAVEKLNLTPDQQKQIADLEKETKAKLDQILTADQKKILEETRPPRGPGGPGGPGGGPGGGGGAGGGGGPAHATPPAK